MNVLKFIAAQKDNKKKLSINVDSTNMMAKFEDGSDAFNQDHGTTLQLPKAVSKGNLGIAVTQQFAIGGQDVQKPSLGVNFTQINRNTIKGSRNAERITVLQ